MDLKLRCIGTEYTICSLGVRNTRPPTAPEVQGTEREQRLNDVRFFNSMKQSDTYMRH